ncbi:hypothetical protein G3N59_11960 [Paraburkholderia sp. Ac-20340]|uniref:hypothetical protein n=1 Tax=Paraburkholderia sp. Ac-20340 TaxID=2703888 RepID=UPI00197F8C88|nr:hypothetical protein [Paraburkholderia sp. Ac-20340]MBN3854096.1 hypothetical protein [Paraburkholderia sp. Ac-20340]
MSESGKMGGSEIGKIVALEGARKGAPCSHPSVTLHCAARVIHEVCCLIDKSFRSGKARENLGNIAGAALANRKPFHLLNPD